MIVRDIAGRLVSFLCEVCEDLVEWCNDGLVFQIFHWDGKYCIGVVIIRHKILLVSFKADGEEGSGGIGVENAILFVC